MVKLPELYVIAGASSISPHRARVVAETLDLSATLTPSALQGEKHGNWEEQGRSIADNLLVLSLKIPRLLWTNDEFSEVTWTVKIEQSHQEVQICIQSTCTPLGDFSVSLGQVEKICL